MLFSPERLHFGHEPGGLVIVDTLDVEPIDDRSSGFRLSGEIDLYSLPAFETAIWKANTHLYRLSATAANESDAKKIAALGKDTAAALQGITEKLDALKATSCKSSSSCCRRSCWTMTCMFNSNFCGC